MTMSARTSVLAQLTADVMAEKKGAAKKLTPVEGEAKPVTTGNDSGNTDALTASGLPSDLPGAFMSGELMTMASKDLRRYAEQLVKIAEGIDTINGTADVVEAPTKAEADREEAVAQKEAERAADEKAAQPDFNAAYKAKQEAAQDAVFKTANPLTLDNLDGTSGITVTDLAEPAEEWSCPEHGVSTTKVSSKGREYLGCPNCNQFKR